MITWRMINEFNAEMSRSLMK